LNDYTRGVIEALAWVRYLLNENADGSKGLEKVQAEVNGGLKLVAEGLARDFPDKFKLVVNTH